MNALKLIRIVTFMLQRILCTEIVGIMCYPETLKVL